MFVGYFLNYLGVILFFKTDINLEEKELFWRGKESKLGISLRGKG